MDILFEIIDKQLGAHIERVHVENGDCISIGRAYDNSVILQDVHLSPHHGQLKIDTEGHWWYEDLGSLNGSFDKSNRRVNQRLEIQSGDILRLGNVRVRIISPQQPVTATLPLSSSPVMEILQQRQWHGLIIVVGLAIFMLDDWLTLTDSRKPSDWIEAVLPFVFITSAWAFYWGLIGKLNTRDERLVSQLGVAIVLIIMFIVANACISMLNFNVGSLLFDKISSGIILFAIMGGGILISQQLATQSVRIRVSVWSYVVAVVVAALMILLPLQKQREFSQSPAYIKSIAPPLFVLRKGSTVDEFVTASSAIFSHEAVKK